MSKRGFQHVRKYQQRCLVQSQKWILHGRRSCLVIFHDKSGVHAYGTKKMKDIFNDVRDQFQKAALEDTRNLSDIDTAVVEETVPENSHADIVTNMYQSNFIKKLDCHLPLMSEEQVMKVLRPCLRMEICKKTGVAITNIKWQDEAHETDMWPKCGILWKDFGNPSQKQTEDFRKNSQKNACEVMKEAVILFMMSRGIDVRNHVDQDEKDVRKKLRARGLKTLDEAYDLFYASLKDPRLLGLALGSGSSPTTVTSPAASETSPLGLTSPSASVISPMASVTSPTASDSSETASGSASGTSPPTGATAGEILPEANENGMEIESEYTDSDSEDVEDMAAASDIFNVNEPRKDHLGRFILPTRPATLSQSSPPTSSPTTTSFPAASSPTSSPSSRTSSSRPSDSRQMFDTNKTDRGRGKGGAFNISNNKLVKVTTSEAKNLKTLWKEWKTHYETSVRKEIIKNKPAKEILCQRCERFIPVSKFLNHKTKYDYCTTMHPFIKFKTFEQHGGITSDHII